MNKTLALMILLAAIGPLFSCRAKHSLWAQQTEVSPVSEITCPHCKFKKSEELPFDVCTLRYTCTNCKKEITPKGKDCCVYCSYGNYECPSIQEQRLEKNK